MNRPFRTTLLALACSAAFAVQAQTDTVRSLHIPSGNLVTALDALAKQTGAQFIYQEDQLRGLQTQGVDGNISTDDALKRLLAGSGYTVRHDASGAMVIVKGAGPRTPAPRATRAATAPDTGNPQAATRLEAVVVTGSRIPRAQVEGPAPVTTITAQDIRNNGFATVADVMTSLTQNLGALDSNQNTDGFSPGAQAVDLRGLGPNHTLVLVNGRRIADYPQSYGGNSNFTDISNLPTSLIDRVEILSGSASAIYGSDAISGVINFILK
ncbi:MAG: TonB-dependent receptor, partial [Rhodanobacter sp.]